MRNRSKLSRNVHLIVSFTRALIFGFLAPRIFDIAPRSRRECEKCIPQRRRAQIECYTSLVALILVYNDLPDGRHSLAKRDSVAGKGKRFVLRTNDK